MLPLGIKVEPQSGFAAGADGNVTLCACWDGTNRLREFRSGGDDVSKFGGGAIDNVQVCAASAAGKCHCATKT